MASVKLVRDSTQPSAAFVSRLRWCGTFFSLCAFIFLFFALIKVVFCEGFLFSSYTVIGYLQYLEACTQDSIYARRTGWKQERKAIEDSMELTLTF